MGKNGFNILHLGHTYRGNALDTEAGTHRNAGDATATYNSGWPHDKRLRASIRLPIPSHHRGEDAAVKVFSSFT